YQPMLGRDGALWVRLGKKLWAFNGESFDRISAPWNRDPYSAVVRKNGDVCWVDFLHAIFVGDRTYALKSADYPGGDPRELKEDEQGTLWVEDFDSGLFRLEANGRFVKQPGIDAKATGVADRGAVMLHYTDGLILDGLK